MYFTISLRFWLPYTVHNKHRKCIIEDSSPLRYLSIYPVECPLWLLYCINRTKNDGEHIDKKVSHE